MKLSEAIKCLQEALEKDGDRVLVYYVMSPQPLFGERQLAVEEITVLGVVDTEPSSDSPAALAHLRVETATTVLC